jgi:DNA-binding NtrC family response regulator
VIVVSGNISLERAIEFKKLGAFDLFTKPFELKNLLATIENALQD